MIKEILSKILPTSKDDFPLKGRVPFQDPNRLGQLSLSEALGLLHNALEQNEPLEGGCVDDFESRLSRWLNSPHCISVGSGTEALTIALRTLQLPHGSQVAIPAFSFISSASCILANQLEPVFVDVSSTSALVSPEAFLPVIESKKVRAMIIPHLFGQMVDLKELSQFAKTNDVFLIEDAAHAFGSTQGGMPPGTLSDIACFSFDPQKILSSFGSGGAIMTSKSELAQAAREIRQYGYTENGEFAWVGMNSRLPSLQAALLTGKLDSISTEIERRKRFSKIYRSQLALVENITFLEELPNQSSNGYRLVLRVPQRNRFLSELLERGIESKIHYPYPLYHHGPFRCFQDKPLEGCELLAESVLSLPLHGGLNDNQVDRVIETVISVAKKIGAR
jgi:UDP-2-acetamido-2-deoxy-ribo-hexuluronate aminotransferase